MNKSFLIPALLIFIVFACQKETGEIPVRESICNCKNSTKAIVDCIQLTGKDYGIMLFGDSMLNLPSSHIMSYFSSFTGTYQGLGNSNYPNGDSFINGKGGFFLPMDGAFSLDVNEQFDLFERSEWPGNVGYMNGVGQNITFKTYGEFPTGSITKLFVLTDPMSIGNYDVERTIDDGLTWNVILNNKSTYDEFGRSMKTHIFDDSSENVPVGYRLKWKSGTVMCLDPLFLEEGGDNIYHITVGSGGADFKLQTTVPKERMRFMIDEANIKMVTSSHRYEVENVQQFKAYQSLMDDWWDGKNIDVLYFGQPPQTDDDAVADQFKRDINQEIYKKTEEKGYLYFDMYTAMGGQEGVIQKGWDEDPIHLNQVAYASIVEDLMSYLGFKDPACLRF